MEGCILSLIFLPATWGNIEIGPHPYVKNQQLLSLGGGGGGGGLA